ncbi:hypothetical protein [Streptomyces virginiae]
MTRRADVHPAPGGPPSGVHRWADPMKSARGVGSGAVEVLTMTEAD